MCSVGYEDYSKFTFVGVGTCTGCHTERLLFRYPKCGQEFIWCQFCIRDDQSRTIVTHYPSEQDKE